MGRHYGERADGRSLWRNCVVRFLVRNPESLFLFSKDLYITYTEAEIRLYSVGHIIMLDIPVQNVSKMHHFESNILMFFLERGTAPRQTIPP